jgi:uncharacterized protein
MNIVVAHISEDEGLTINHLYPEGEPDLKSYDTRLIGGAELNLQATRAGDEVELVGEVTAVVGFECDRCLGPLSVLVRQSFELLYVPPLKIQDERELGVDDLSVGFYQGGVIDADDLVREQIELTLPMARLCSDDCRGLCPECGANLNERQCACEIEEVDARLSALKELKSRFN